MFSCGLLGLRNTGIDCAYIATWLLYFPEWVFTVSPYCILDVSGEPMSPSGVTLVL